MNDKEGMLTDAECQICEKLSSKLQELEYALSTIDYSNPDKVMELQKEYAETKEIVELWTEYSRLVKQLQEIKSIDDDELKSLAKEEESLILDRLSELSKKLKLLLIPEEPDDTKNVFLEIRAGAGGDEASIFAGDLFRCYQRYCDSKGWRVEIIDYHENPVGGFKEIIAHIIGNRVYKSLKFEKGVHRVQRVPKTEASGRIHTSTVTVAVLPEVEEREVQIEMKDLKIETFRASGAGGQYVNTTDSAVRITHIPTGIVVAIQDERSQHKNKEKALKVLRARLYEKQREEAASRIEQDRKAQVGTGERAEKIRTYNYMQNRVTDHRVGLSWHNLDQIMEGELDPIIEALSTTLKRETN